MKPFTIVRIDYSEARNFVAKVHRHCPIAPPMVQIRCSFGLYWKGDLRAVAMLGNPVSPHLSRTHLEVRRLASDGIYGACSSLYLLCNETAIARNRKLVTYTLQSETGASLIASGAVETGRTHGGTDYRSGRTNRLAGIPKLRWEWTNDL